MNLHLVGGFLGSGKTTAIIHAAKALMDRGQTVGVITNDQGKFLVDTAFFRLSTIPTVEVTGGCFCCNYNDLDDRLAQIVAEAQPDVIFAESVGSCADIVATVVRPLLELETSGGKPASFSVFADGRLLRRRLLGEEMPFSDDVMYIFDKQIEEAALVVVNKMDLLSSMALAGTIDLLADRYPEKLILAQDSRTLGGVQAWLDTIQMGKLVLPEYPLEMNYSRYGAGEAQLAWLDEEVLMEFPDGLGKKIIQKIILDLVSGIEQKQAGIGHLKLAVLVGRNVEKISIPTLIEPGWEDRIPWIEGTTALLLINARVEMNVEALRSLAHSVLSASGADCTIRSEEAFYPGAPNPTHRFS